jgi:hypothetical protein
MGGHKVNRGNNFLRRWQSYLNEDMVSPWRFWLAIPKAANIEPGTSFGSNDKSQLDLV